MAFTFRNAKNIDTDSLFIVEKASLYLYSDQAFPHYKNSKLIEMFTSESEQEQPADVPQHYFSGTVTQNAISVNRQINVHRRDTGDLVGSTISSGIGGSFYVETTFSGVHYAVCLDNEIGVDYNDLIYGNIYPATISG